MDLYTLKMRRAQIWSIDLIMGISIFLIVAMLYFAFVNNISAETQDSFDRLYSEVTIISDKLLEQGKPHGWNRSNIEEIGITDGHYRLNSTKLNYTISLDYSSLKLLLNARSDFLVFFQNKTEETVSLAGTTYLGKPGITEQNLHSIEDPDNLVAAKRFIIFNNSIYIMVAYSWD